jgi:AraC-like DNA-binding protein
MTIQVRSISLAKYAAIARGLGIDPISMCRHVGLDPACLHKPDLRIPEVALARVLDASSQSTPSQSIGLLMGETWRLSDFGVLSLLLQHQASLRDALAQMRNYRHLLSDSVDIGITEYPQAVVLRCALMTGRSHPGRQPIELAVAALLALCRHQLGKNWFPRAVHFSHPAPANTSVHERIFGHHLTFDADFDGLVMAADELDRIRPEGDPDMARYARDYMDLQPRGPQAAMSRSVRNAVRILLPGGQHHIEQVVDQLGVSVRTLQRQLSQEGLSFQGLVNDVRREQVLHLLASEVHNVTDIAHKMGFAETSAFSRWFTQQFGVSPTAWKKSQSRA